MKKDLAGYILAQDIYGRQMDRQANRDNLPSFVVPIYGNHTFGADVEVKTGEILTISEAATLILADGVKLENNGIIINNGIISGAGTIQNNDGIIDNWGEISVTGVIDNTNGTIYNNRTINSKIKGNQVILSP